ncbi:acetyltransferase family protein [Mycobacterium xenopi 3993]|nr:acetyltransferase family protein [Mycobacterium xenopi 3993]
MESGIAQQLMRATIDVIDSWNVTATALFTFANSVEHIHLYQKFGFWPRFLTALLAKSPASKSASFTRYSETTKTEQTAAVDACRHLTSSIYDGLDVSAEIRSVHEQQLGETVLLWNGNSVDAFAVCHLGEGTEAAPKPVTSSSRRRDPAPTRSAFSGWSWTRVRRWPHNRACAGCRPGSTLVAAGLIAACWTGVFGPTPMAWRCIAPTRRPIAGRRSTSSTTCVS